ncbi:MAG: hypothetical protein PHV39_07040 [Methanomicrobium sp.]|nr:hypothetical protein [Methanomicrobium sp.]
MTKNYKKTVIAAFIIIVILTVSLLFTTIYTKNIYPESESTVSKQEGYIQASVISKLVPAYGDKYYSNAEFWSESIVHDNPIRLYDTDGTLFQYLFTVSNETQKLGMIAIAANKSLGMPVMAIDDGEKYLLHYYHYNEYYPYENSHEMLREYLRINNPDISNSEIKNITYDLFRFSPGVWLNNDKSGDSAIICMAKIHNLSFSAWNRTNPVGNNYDHEYISERVSDWKTANIIFKKTYDEFKIKGINLSFPLSKDEMENFTEYAAENNRLYNASNGCRPFCLPPIYPEEVPVSKSFHEHAGISFKNPNCLQVFFDESLPDNQINAIIKSETDDPDNLVIKTENQELLDYRFYCIIPIDEFNEIRTDVILGSKMMMSNYKISGDNIYIYFNGLKEDISPLIHKNHDLSYVKQFDIWYDEENTDQSYIDQQRQKLDRNENVILTSFE